MSQFIKRTITKSNEEIWEKFLLLQEFFNSGMNFRSFERQRGIQKHIINTWHTYIYFRSRSNIKYHTFGVTMALSQIKSGIAISDFAERFKLTQSEKNSIVPAKTHLGYHEILSHLHKEKGLKFDDFNKDYKALSEDEIPDFIKTYRGNVKQMEFKQIVAPIVNAPKEEIVLSHNDLELTVKKGIKVCVDSTVSSSEIIKIMEFLRSL